MNDESIHAEPRRDLMLATVLREASGRLPDAAVDWEQLRAVIAARAGPQLARQRHGPAWWEYAATWSRAALPALLAASVVIVAALAVPELSTPDADGASVTSAADAPEQAIVDAAVAGDVPVDTLMAALVAAAADGWLVQGAIDDE